MENMCTVQVKLELGHRAQLRKKATTEGFTHDWMVFVRGPETCDIQHFVERVVFRLHDSFPKPKRVCKEPPYKVEESGYAGFLMPIEVYFKNKEEPKKVCFNYDLFLNLEGNPPVNHLRCEKLTFNNPTHEFRRKLVKAGGVMVIPEGAELMPKPGPDYPMLPTIPLSAFSDPKKIKSSHGIKEPNKDGAGGSSKGPKPHKPAKEHRDRSRKDSESKVTSRESDREGSKSTREPSSSSSSSSSRKATDVRGKEEGKVVPKAAFKEPKLTLRESKIDGTSPKGGGSAAGGGGGGGGQIEARALSKRPPSTTESPKLSTKKQKSTKGSSSGGFSGTSPRISSTTPSAYPEKKASKEKSHWAKMRPDVPEVKRQPESEESNSEDEASSKSEQSAQSSPSSSSSSSSSDSDFEPSQKQGQGPLRSMVEDMHSEGSDDDSSSEVETPMKTPPPNQDSRLSMDSESDIEEPRPPSQEAPSPPPKLSTVNLKMLEKKSPDSCTREKTLKRGEDKVGRAYTEELVDLHRRLMALRERNILQQIVNLIEKTGHFNVTNTTFDFDLFSLDESTVRKLQSYLEATST
ncbi:MLLT1 super elongation complex subunit b isoform X1 [Electrophorus electricus]|uniref:MLLT1 super elongation complex subunit b isoform X1 n=1 Tax=Electrophorus electricus TaxID=8005 RepID=UPI0015CFE096|nr:MLLT1 super elongation complex subunit b isoform X1 [Electrophorus electricus]